MLVRVSPARDPVCVLRVELVRMDETLKWRIWSIPWIMEFFNLCPHLWEHSGVWIKETLEQVWYRWRGGVSAWLFCP